MIVKIDTKEKFHVITPGEPTLSENMTEEFSQLLLSCREKDIKNVVLSLKEVTSIDSSVAQAIVNCQQDFYDNETSFVVCEMTPDVESFFEAAELLDLLNFTPTESEAWDIVQMEEIERDLFEEE
ncbi:anti-sigma factor antagonist [Lacibacter luteus]|uniref:Anti-sigma factor antagonist n=1 Tax=Lacibacter luteus TaxID=2508719 RepID=A0A4V1M836_9BACT|nr:STAS domain-containing protein [Lacibacter luteus]RXK62482.1 anti-sigma factor antagonist [Lacibacter luteus]